MRKNFTCDVFMNEEVFRRITNTGPLTLGIYNDFIRKLRISRTVNIDIAHPFKMFNHRYGRIFYNKAYILTARPKTKKEKAAMNTLMAMTSPMMASDCCIADSKVAA